MPVSHGEAPAKQAFTFAVRWGRKYRKGRSSGRLRSFDGLEEPFVRKRLDKVIQRIDLIARRAELFGCCGKMMPPEYPCAKAALRRPCRWLLML